MGDIEINIKGNNNTFEIKEDTFIQKSRTVIQGNKNLVTLGKSNEINGLTIWCFENKGIIKLGNNCLLSYDIEIRNTDSHPIYDIKIGNRLNKSEDVIVKDKVWIGSGVRILKGVIIEEGNIIGQRAIVTKSIIEKNSIIVGNNKIIKNNVRWEKEFEK